MVEIILWSPAHHNQMIAILCLFELHTVNLKFSAVPSQNIILSVLLLEELSIEITFFVKSDLRLKPLFV